MRPALSPQCAGQQRGVTGIWSQEHSARAINDRVALSRLGASNLRSFNEDIAGRACRFKGILPTYDRQLSELASIFGITRRTSLPHVRVDRIAPSRLRN
jgi:hypothetical protein